MGKGHTETHNDAECAKKSFLMNYSGIFYVRIRTGTFTYELEKATSAQQFNGKQALGHLARLLAMAYLLNGCMGDWLKQ
jgi:hypothetical protein